MDYVFLGGQNVYIDIIHMLKISWLKLNMFVCTLYMTLWRKYIYKKRKYPSVESMVKLIGWKKSRDDNVVTPRPLRLDVRSLALG